MEIKKDKQGDTLILSPVGRLDGNSADTFKQQLSAASNKGEKQILMNFSDTEFISSMGLRVIISFAQTMKQSDEKVSFVCPNSSVMEVFKSAGFAMIFSFYDSVKDALSSA